MTVDDKPRLLDLFCKAGGATKGYQQAGFYVVGVDIEPQPHYCGDEFYQADALTYPLEGFDAYHASPPCQRYSVMTNGRWQDRLPNHPDLIQPVRERLSAIGKPYIIENVPGAKLLLINPIMLCGTAFNLGTKDGNQLRRHRFFELSFPFDGFLLQCQHNRASAIGVYGGGQYPLRRKPATIGVYGHAGGSSNRDGLTQFGTDARREAMGIDWMTGNELSQAIPPAYTDYIGKYLMAEVKRLSQST